MSQASPRPKSPRLSTPFPTTFATLTIAPSPITSGTATVWGTSSYDTTCSNVGMKERYRTITVPTSTPLGCPGDSGGPRTVGTVYPIGAIDAVHSTGGAGNPTGESLVTPHRTEINDIIARWNASGSTDISNWTGAAWCTHSTSRLYYGDVDLNDEVDAICHDFVTGNRWVATGDANPRTGELGEGPEFDVEMVQVE